jgi:SAM-dependent methyltransferase
MSPVRFEAERDAGLAEEGCAFFDSPAGRRLEQAEMAVLRQQLDDCSGARVLLLGAGTDERVLDALSAQRRHVARIARVDVQRRSPVSRTHAVIADPGNLPYANDSFDLVVLFHALDLVARPHQALREVTRVLTDGGRLVVTGFNPWSLWGLWRLVSRQRPLRDAGFINPVRMADWLSLLDFRVTTTEFTGHRPAFGSTGSRSGVSIVRAVLRLIRMPFGTVWIIKARRELPAASGMTPALEPRTVAAPVAAGSTARGAARHSSGSGDGHRARSGNVFPFASLHDRNR